MFIINSNLDLTLSPNHPVLPEALATLEVRLENPESPRDRVDVLNQLAWELRRSDVERSIAYHEQALKALETLEYDKGWAYA
ncbi:MAG: hypothetical protein AAFQ98_12120, partial [Bacteroidota bacterium]